MASFFASNTISSDVFDNDQPSDPINESPIDSEDDDDYDRLSDELTDDNQATMIDQNELPVVYVNKVEEDIEISSYTPSETAKSDSEESEDEEVIVLSDAEEDSSESESEDDSAELGSEDETQSESEDEVLMFVGSQPPTADAKDESTEKKPILANNFKETDLIFVVETMQNGLKQINETIPQPDSVCCSDRSLEDNSKMAAHSPKSCSKLSNFLICLGLAFVGCLLIASILFYAQELTLKYNAGLEAIDAKNALEQEVNNLHSELASCQKNCNEKDVEETVKVLSSLALFGRCFNIRFKGLQRLGFKSPIAFKICV